MKTAGKRQRDECKGYAADVELFADRTEASRHTHTHTLNSSGRVQFVWRTKPNTSLHWTWKRNRQWHDEMVVGGVSRSWMPSNHSQSYPATNRNIWLGVSCLLNPASTFFSPNKIINHIHFNIKIKSFFFSHTKAAIFQGHTTHVDVWGSAVVDLIQTILTGSFSTINISHLPNVKPLKCKLKMKTQCVSFDLLAWNGRGDTFKCYQLKKKKVTKYEQLNFHFIKIPIFYFFFHERWPCLPSKY